MNYHTTIFRQMLQLFSRLEFQSVVNRYKGDFHVRTCRCWDQMIHMLFSQFSKRDSLRETTDTMSSQYGKHYHLGIRPIPRSTLSDANHLRDHRIYQDLFFIILDRVQRIAPKYKLNLDRKFFVLDSTTIDLCLKLFPWARFRKTKAAVKIHTLMQVDGSLPTFIRLTDGKVHDSTIGREIKIPPGSYLAIDRAYHDFNQYKVYNDNNIRFVTLKKTNAKYRVVKKNSCIKSQGILSDQTIEFTGYTTHKKYPNSLRLIHYQDQEIKRTFEFLTNDFESEPVLIAKIYKARWEIELFFKTIKQNLKIKRFIGASPNAVWTQVWIAMIAYLLIRYIKFMNQSKYSMSQLFHRIQVNLFERKPIDEILFPRLFRPPEINTAQCCLFTNLTGH
jgi:Domain of unknown function (DUF4372)/Transposase DDE domain